MGLTEILALLVVASGAFVVWGNLKAREIANAAIRAVCRAQGLLFLDDTVALESVWPVRDDEGRLRLRRVYSFEYSDTGNNRRKGSVTLIAETVHALDVGPPLLPEGEIGGSDTTFRRDRNSSDSFPEKSCLTLRESDLTGISIAVQCRTRCPCNQPATDLFVGVDPPFRLW